MSFSKIFETTTTTKPLSPKQVGVGKSSNPAEAINVQTRE